MKQVLSNQLMLLITSLLFDGIFSKYEKYFTSLLTTEYM